MRLVFVIMLLAVLDLLTTYLALALGLEEANPIMKPIIYSYVGAVLKLSATLLVATAIVGVKYRYFNTMLTGYLHTYGYGMGKVKEVKYTRYIVNSLDLIVSYVVYGMLIVVVNNLAQIFIRIHFCVQCCL